MRGVLLPCFMVAFAAGLEAQPPSAPQRGARLDTQGFIYEREIPPGEAGLARLTLDAAALAHSQGPLRTFADVRIVDDENVQIPYLLERTAERLTVDLQLRAATPAARVLQEHRGGARSFYALTLPYAGLPGPVVTLETSARIFQRGVQLGAERQPDRRSREVTFEMFTQATWQHSDEAAPAPALELALPRDDARELLLIVDEGDNQPLSITRARLRLPGWQLRFQRPAGRLRLLYGKNDISEPHYDVAVLAPSAMSGEAREISAAGEKTADVPAAVMSPRFFWVGLAVAALLLLAVLVRLIVSGTAPPPSPPGP